ncbi:MAG TPA: DUF1800 domain-containing protein [Frankiaceae bacterium]
MAAEHDAGGVITGVPAETPAPARRVDRRRMLTSTLVAAGTALAGDLLVQGRPATAQPRPGPPTRQTGPTAAVGTPTATIISSSSPATTTPANLLGSDQNWHLARRATFGATPALVAEIGAMGAGPWLEQQLAPAGIDDSACDAYLTRFGYLGLSTPQLRAAIPRFSWDGASQMLRATLARRLWSRRQLFEQLVAFWHDHLHVAMPTGENWDTAHTYDRDVIRAGALGRFADLLVASAGHPAMLSFLDLTNSTGDALNENYGRELLELHTVGVDAGYTQADVVTSARIMTGWCAGVHGEPAYHSDAHYTGPVSLLGFSSPNTDELGGMAVGTAYLTYLARHPSTARRIATKLAVRFVSDTPPAALVTALAKVYTDNDTAIVPVLRALFSSAEFRASIGQKVKRPDEDQLGAYRALGAAPGAGDGTSLSALYWALNGLGHAPMAWPPPDGYPDTADAWVSTSGTVGRFNGHAAVVDSWWTDGIAKVDPSAALPTPTPASIGALVDAVATRLLGVPLGAGSRQALLQFFTGLKRTTPAQVVQYDAPILLKLILDMPEWLQR